MASSAAAAAPERNRVAEGNPPVAVAPPRAWPNPPPPPPPPAAHEAVFADEMFLDPAGGRQPFLRPDLPLLLFRTLIWVLLLFLAIASFAVLMWMIFHPNFPQLCVASAAMSTVTLTGTTATAGCNITFMLTNTNRHLITIFNRMEVALVYPSEQILLSQDYLPPFVQPTRSRITLQANLGFNGVDLGSQVVNALKQDLDRGSLSLVFKLIAVVRYRHGNWKTKPQHMRAYCNGVSFGFPSSHKPGIFLNPYQECEVYLYSK